MRILEEVAMVLYHGFVLVMADGVLWLKLLFLGVFDVGNFVIFVFVWMIPGEIDGTLSPRGI